MISVSARRLTFIVKENKSENGSENGIRNVVFPESKNLDLGSPLDWVQDFRGSASPPSSLDIVLGEMIYFFVSLYPCIEY